MEEKSNFIGSRVEYTESMPYSELNGVVKDLSFDAKKKFFTIHIEAGEESFPYQVSVSDLEITEEQNYFRFRVCGLSAFAGSAKIFK